MSTQNPAKDDFATVSPEEDPLCDLYDCGDYDPWGEDPSFDDDFDPGPQTSTTYGSYEWDSPGIPFIYIEYDAVETWDKGRCVHRTLNVTSGRIDGVLMTAKQIEALWGDYPQLQDLVWQHVEDDMVSAAEANIEQSLADWAEGKR